MRSPLSKTDPRFLRLVELLIDLHDTGHLDWARDPRKDVQFSIVIRDLDPKRTQEIGEVLALLDQPQKIDDSAPIVLPVYHAIEEPESGGIAVTTSSIYNLIEIMSASF